VWCFAPDQAEILFRAHRYQEAAAAARLGIERAPKRTAARLVLGDSLLMLGPTSQPQAPSSQIPKENPLRLTSEAILKARTGDRAGSDRALVGLKAMLGGA